MFKREEKLQKDEVIIMRAKPHWAIFAPVLKGALFIVILQTIGPFVPLVNQTVWQNLTVYGVMTLAVSFFTLLNGLLILYHQQTAHYILTNKRIMARFGTLYAISYDMLLTRIESIEIRQTPILRLLNCGHVILRGVISVSPTLPYMPYPQRFRDKLYELLG